MTKCSLLLGTLTQNVEDLIQNEFFMYHNSQSTQNMLKAGALQWSREGGTGVMKAHNKTQPRANKAASQTEWHGGHTFALMIASADCTSPNGTSSSSTSSSSVLKRASYTNKAKAKFQISCSLDNTNTARVHPYKDLKTQSHEYNEVTTETK